MKSSLGKPDVAELRRRLADPEVSVVTAPWVPCGVPSGVVTAVAAAGEALDGRFDPDAAGGFLRRSLRALDPELPGAAETVLREATFLVTLFATAAQDPSPRLLLTADPADLARPPETAPEEGEPALSLTVFFPRQPDGSRPPRTGADRLLFVRGLPDRETLLDSEVNSEESGLWLRLSSPCSPDPTAVEPDLQLARLREGDPSRVDVALISMPFAALRHPSLGLTSLKGTLPERLRVEVLYFTYLFAGLTGPAFYEWISSGRPGSGALLGEWVFSRALRDEAGNDQAGDEVEPYLDEVLRSGELAGQVAEGALPWLVELRSRAGRFLDRCADRVLALKPRMVGFTSVFQQHAAALALARRLVERRPGLPVVFGGANCEGVMGRALLRRFPWVGAVVSGEGERIFPELVDRVLDGRDPSDLPGVLTQSRVAAGEADKTVSVPNAPAVQDMDALPRIDYADHFRHWRASGLGADSGPRLLFETARGCWWGEKHHCTFCGLNGSGMAFRSKSPERVLDELETLVERHPGFPVAVVDNILDLRYLRTLVPEMARRQLGIELFYEVKANLKKEQLRLLHDAGIREIQPGIESLSSEVLRIMRKGVSGLQNLQLLKWCKELGIRVYWNFLWGFAGERPAEYERMARIVPWLTHLQPPEAIGTHRLDRFSPNYFEGERLGYRDIRPYPAYRYVYGNGQAERTKGSEPADLEELAYYFQYDYRDGRDVASYVARLRRRLEEWQDLHRGSDLLGFDRGGRLMIFDYRPASGAADGKGRLTVLTGRERELVLACDSVRSLDRLARRHGLEGPEEVAEILAPLIDRGLLVRDGDLVLALSVAAGAAEDSGTESRGEASVDLPAIPDGAAA